MLKRKKLFWITSALVLLLLCLFLSLPFLHLRYYVRHLDNPYVNDRYPGWRDVSINADIRVKIPEDWILETEGDACKIFDRSGRLLAEGGRNEQNEARAETFLQEQTHAELLSHTVEVRDVMRWNMGSCCIWNAALSNGTQCSFVILILRYNYDYEYEICFLPMERDELTEIFQKAEAVAWSMTYEDEALNGLEQRALHLR